MSQPEWPENIHICIPSYNAERTMREFLPKLLSIVPSKKVLVIDDASSDHTNNLCALHDITCLKHKSNKGKGAALNTGFQYILQQKKNEWIITMDADGQHAIQDLTLFVSYVQNNPDTGICIGKREMRIGKMPIFRIGSNKITSTILSMVCGTPILDSQCGYRIYSTKLLSNITIDNNRFEMESEVIIKAAFLGYPVGFTPVQTVYLDGTSHISHLKDTIRWIRAVLSLIRTVRR